MNRKAFEIFAVLLAALFLSVTSLMAAGIHTLYTPVPESARAYRLSFVPATNRLQLAIGLPLRDQDKLTNLLHGLYAPGNTNFHRYLKPAQFAARFGPADQDYQSVLNFAKTNHLQVVQEYGNHAVVDVVGSVADIENAFHVTLGYYQHPTENRLFYGPDVPPTIDARLPISYVLGLDNYILPETHVRTFVTRAARPQPGVDNGSGTNNLYIGTDFRNAYVPGVSLKGEGQVLGLVEYSGFTPSDITEYESLAGLTNNPPLIEPVVLPGDMGVPCTNCGNLNPEIALDIEMVVALAPHLSAVIVVEGTDDTDALNELATLTNSAGGPLANQISSSYGSQGEPDCEPQLWQFAAQGQSFFLASGDAGAPSNGVKTTTADYNYLTTVGGTELSMNGAGLSWSNELVWGPPFTGTNGGSIGYFDTGIAIPAYQKDINTTANGGSSIFRNVPDVAMCADNIEIVSTVTSTNQPIQTGVVGGAAGTSAAAPLWAAFTALVNEQALNQNLPTIGFLDPAIYDLANGPLYATYFHDITNGANTNNISPNLYFAGPGYDNCTGLGSPNGQAMINALVAYTGPIWVDFSAACPGNGTYTNPFCSLALATNAVPRGGNIWIIGPSSTSFAPAISKPMTIRAFGGSVIIGN